MNMAKTDCMAVALFGREGGSSCGGWFVNAVEALGEVWGGLPLPGRLVGPAWQGGKAPWQQQCLLLRRIIFWPQHKCCCCTAHPLLPLVGDLDT